MSDLQAPPPPDHAAAFRAMGDKIEANAGNGFAGAFVIVGPDGAVETMLMLDEKPNPSAFWSLVTTKAQIAIAEAEANQRQDGGFGFGGGRR